MNNCSNCYSNCGGNTQSDKCVKYTGVDIAFLGISTGDNLNFVTGAITNFLATVADGTGIVLDGDSLGLCQIITDELNDLENIRVLDIVRALSVAICEINTRTITLEDFNTNLEVSYASDCVPGIIGNEGTHAVLQAVINHLCSVATDLDALELDLATNYVEISEIDTYISNYIAANPATLTGQKAKMIPYTVVEYYGPLDVFNATGAGLGDWEQIYLCNGENGTPDKRGRIGIGTTNGMGGGTFPAATNPLLSGNPTYNLYSVNGANTVTLTEGQIPAHTHNVTDPGHNHTITPREGTMMGDILIPAGGGTPNDDTLRLNDIVSSNNETSNNTTGISISSSGGGQSHSNVPPVLACHYIMYIPTV